MANVKRLMGFNVLFPFGFHGTGTPIVACANKVTKEMEAFTKEMELESTSQLGILEAMGVSRSEFGYFQDPNYWIDYFPKVAKEDLKRFGISADLNRSFITTEINPHYDSFIRWQFERLRLAGVLEYGKRFMIYSPDTCQPCSDHDRSVGEGIEPKEYTLIKLKLDSMDNTYLLAGTLRPEIMYGQTNVWINKEGVYSLFEIDGVKYISRYETYFNLHHQLETSKVNLIERTFIKGNQLLGQTVTTPYVDKSIPILPMGKVSMYKGTGIVTSVPTDSPTDYLYWKEHLGTKPILTGIIDVDGSSTFAADQVNAHNLSIGNNIRLDEIHEIVCTREHDEGILIVGKYSGETLKEACTKIKRDLLDANDAITYYEPESRVVSRTGVECVVALTDQWYINYGIKETTERVNRHIDNDLKMFDDVSKAIIRKASDWIDKWPVSRLATHCLGTKLPVDERFMIDSLSDSTAYFAYYTICNTVTTLPIDAMTFAAWEYIFTKTNTKPEHYEKYNEQFDKMKKEFWYWYPLDLRVSGRDLLTNHLNMALYNHAILWPNENMMPQAYYTNGYALLNGKKMSKSTGNFLTLDESITKFGCDAVRVALASAGDGMTDGNFDEHVAYNAITFLNNELNRIVDTVEIINKSDPCKEYDSSDNVLFWDTVFINEINSTINKFIVNIHKMNIRKAFVCVYDLVNSRDEYYNINTNKAIIWTTNRKIYHTTMMVYMKNFINMISIFCPFWRERLSFKMDIETIFGEFSWFKMRDVDSQNSWIKDSMFDLIKQIRVKYARMRAKNKKQYSLAISVYTNHDDEINGVAKALQAYNCGNLYESKIKEFFTKLMKNTSNKKLKAKIGMFSKTATNAFRDYGVDWLEWVIDSCTTEADFIEIFAHKLIHEIDFETVTITRVDFSISSQYGPGFPSFIMS